jgi:hypothetical protein
MKKKILLIAVVLFVVAAASGFSWAVGGAFSIDPLGGLPSNAMLTFKIQEIPIMWGLGLVLGEERFSLGLTADWWLYHSPLVGILSIYVGPGLYGAVGDIFEFGGRVPIGLQIFPIKPLELFLEIAPALIVVSNRAITIPRFGIQGAFGFRFWF